MALKWFVAACVILGATSAIASGGTVVAQTRSWTPSVMGYARVAPIAVIEVRARATGIVQNLHVLPGDHVSLGAPLGGLGGADIQSLLAQRKAAEDQAQANVEAAKKALKIGHQTGSERLTTHLTLIQARASLARTEALLAQAKAEFLAARNAQLYTAPVDGTVLSVRVGNGSSVQAGQTLLTLQADGKLWLYATFYGQDAVAVQAGMRGEFKPTDRHAAIGVRVRSIIGPVAADGGESVAMLPIDSQAAWRNGEAGTVRLRGVAQKAVMIPTSALILDQGRWWVLVHEQGKDQRRQVTPGVQRGDWTVISDGVKSGEAVVVTDAYLRFHKNFARQYQAPD